MAFIVSVKELPYEAEFLVELGRRMRRLSVEQSQVEICNPFGDLDSNYWVAMIMLYYNVINILS
jgi:hypothetical protein